jgi:hypothetical protein
MISYQQKFDHHLKQVFMAQTHPLYFQIQDLIDSNN